MASARQRRSMPALSTWLSKSYRGAIESKLDEAKRGAEEAEEGSEARARCERDAKRYEAFLSVLSD